VHIFVVCAVCRAFILQQNKDQENVRVGVKDLAAGVRPAAIRPAGTKRAALAAIQNDCAVPRVLVTRKVGVNKVCDPQQK
jgi:hypothetical protein